MREKQIPSGYKKTEIGIIPEDWEVKRLGEVCRINPESLSENTPKEFEFNYIPLELIDKGRLKGFNKLKFENAPSRARRVVRKGDVLFSTVRPYLLSHFYYNDYPKNTVCSTGFSILRCKSDLLSMYLYFHLFFKTINRQIDKILAGSNYPAINSNDVKSFQIPLPPLPEQRAIAQILSDFDHLIESLDKLIEKKKAIKKGAMQELLTGKKRLPGFKGEWVRKKLGEVGKIVTGGTPSTKIKKFWNGKIPWITPTDISNKKDIYDSERKITKEGQKLVGEIPENTLLVTCIASIGKNAILRVNGACNQQINAVILDRNYNVYFLYYTLEFNSKRLFEMAGTTTTPIISKSEFSLFQIPLPPLSEQHAIAQILSDMDSEIEALERKRDKYKMIKKGAMQLLLTGKVRLK